MEFTQEQKLYAEIVQIAWEDENFKKELVANPVEAIENLTGRKLNLPKGKTLVARDQTAEDTVYINIPAKPEMDLELDENELEVVSGGSLDTLGVAYDAAKKIYNLFNGTQV
ncbi:TOMM propeptide domain-containing protein [Chryseobacterium manosquense]|uniref:TOMM propeptide domain-containing protein n=1 Tax=Chryseobacterium manosquense TaxID=2754694 RepID=A0A7H1DXH6_9FLAO|nr:TOMM propeptide domain-containing protein [Chryseobacterium manosquense]QNS41684.1 TOMM propeptide domain-containing protein [Chryseobacterium manosquense]